MLNEDDNGDRAWWERTWTEREDALWDVFGPSRPDGAPEGYVSSYKWEDVPLPGACCYTFPSRETVVLRDVPARPTWLYVTHGLAQWCTLREWDAARGDGNRSSGPGYELAMSFDRAAPWVPGLLRSLMAGDHEQRSGGGRGFRAGDRIPFFFASLSEDDLRWGLGGDLKDAKAAADDTRSLVFWRYLTSFGSFTTSTGEFELRVGTTTTGAELKLAQETSSCHLLLLLEWAGVGQRSIPGRACVTRRPDWERAWREIGNLPFDDAKGRLAKLAKRMVLK